MKINYNIKDMSTMLDELYDNLNKLDDLRNDIADSLLEYPQIKIDDLFFNMKKDNIYTEELEEYIRKYILK